MSTLAALSASTPRARGSGDELALVESNVTAESRPLLFFASPLTKSCSGKHPRHHGQVNEGPADVGEFISWPQGVDKNGVGTFLKRDPWGNYDM